MIDGTVTTRPCNTPGCGKQTPHLSHAFCEDCIGTVLRTGRGPDPQPAWRRRVDDPAGMGATMGLAGKDFTGASGAAA